MTGNAQNIAIRNNMMSGRNQIHDKPRCHATQPGGFSVANFGAIIGFSSTFYDPEGIWNITAPSRLTIRTKGAYDVKHNAQLTASAAGNSRQAWVMINGGTARYAYDLRAPSAVATRLIGSDTLDLNAGDYLELFVYQDSGGALVLAPAVGAYNGADLKVTLLSTT